MFKVYNKHICLYSMDTVVLGGTHQENDFNTNVCPDDRKFIIDGCRQIVPPLEHATHLYDWVGLRPGRLSLRLEAEKMGICL